MSLADETKRGRLEGLRELRDQLARILDSCESARDYASLSQRLMDVLAQIAALEAEKPEVKGTPLDEINARRAAKTAAGSGGSSRRRV